MGWRWVAADAGMVFLVVSLVVAPWSRTAGLILVVLATAGLFMPMVPRRRG
jgi:hypothetical protein